MDQKKRDEIWDQVPLDFPIVDADDEVERITQAGGGTIQSWGAEAGHDIDGALDCHTCGKGGPCPFIEFYDSVVSSVVRELDKIGALVPTRLDETLYPEDMQRGDATVSADMCPNCKGDNEDAFELCSNCSHRSEDDWQNDPFNLWGKAPSYRCYMTRHKACEPEGVDKGCTCSCGHQEPVCACSTRVLDAEGKLVHTDGCPAA